jgi:3-dehydroquinate dehydratase II
MGLPINNNLHLFSVCGYDVGMTYDILLLNGPNLNMLGKREPHIYGQHSLGEIELQCQACASQYGLSLHAFQSNYEGALLDCLHEHFGKVRGIIINPAGLTHSSVALHDGLTLMDVPIIEVHLSNIHAREPFRHHSYISSIAKGVICGLGVQGYGYAVDALAIILADSV